MRRRRAGLGFDVAMRVDGALRELFPGGLQCGGIEGHFPDFNANAVERNAVGFCHQVVGDSLEIILRRQRCRAVDWLAQFFLRGNGLGNDERDFSLRRQEVGAEIPVLEFIDRGKQAESPAFGRREIGGQGEDDLRKRDARRQQDG